MRVSSDELRPEDAAPAANSAPSGALRSAGQEPDVAERVVEKLARLDKDQFRRLVEELGIVLLDAMRSDGAATAGVGATGSQEVSADTEEERSSELPPLGGTLAATTVVESFANSRAPRSNHRSVPRRIGVVVASRSLATIAALLLFVPAANPPLQPVEDARPVAMTEPAPTQQTRKSIETRPGGRIASGVTYEIGTDTPAAAQDPGPQAASAETSVVGRVPAAGALDQLQVTATDPGAAIVAASGGAPAVSSTNDGRLDAPTLGPSVSAPISVSNVPNDPVSTIDAPAPTNPEAVAPPISASATEGQPPSQFLPQPSESGPAGSSTPPIAKIRSTPSTPSLEVVQALLQRGDYFLALGDIASARGFYERAAEAGSVAAATGMARTYDPQFLKEIGVIGIRGDKIKAVNWYRRASQGGDPAATERLNSLLAGDSG